MKTSIYLALGAALVCLSSRAYAENSQMTVSDLNGFCSAQDESSVSACRFYILGVMEGLSLGSAYEAKTAESKKHFCVPEGIGQSETVSLVKRKMLQDLASFPQDKTLPAVSFVSAVLAQTYPCAK